MKDTYTAIELMAALQKVTEKPLFTMNEEQRKKATPEMFVFNELYCAGAKAVIDALIGSLDDDEIDRQRMITEGKTCAAMLLSVFRRGEESALAVGKAFHAGEPESENVNRA